jgi:hypothetical protein
MFVSYFAITAASVRIDKTADSGKVANLELGDLRANTRDSAEDLMARHHGVARVSSPVVFHVVQIRVANTAKKDIDLNVMLLRGTTDNSVRNERRCGT